MTATLAFNELKHNQIFSEIDRYYMFHWKDGVIESSGGESIFKIFFRTFMYYYDHAKFQGLTISEKMNVLVVVVIMV